MKTPQEIAVEKVLDVRSIPCSGKHGMILERWFALPVEDYFVLVNHHDPAALRYQLDAAFPGSFTWEYLKKDAGEVRIKITKLSAVAPDRERDWTCPSVKAQA